MVGVHGRVHGHHGTLDGWQEIPSGRLAVAVSLSSVSMQFLIV
jgi:hypothetical protein